MNIFDHSEFSHEMVAFSRDDPSGLQAIIAIHNTLLGPAIGGCRMMPYATEASALTDVLRLSKGMTYKCAIGDIPFGGGKAVIIGSPEKDKTPELLHAMGAFVDRLGGSYITSFDAGTSMADVATMGERTAHVGGIRAGAGNASQSTALGIYICMRKAAELKLGAADLRGVRIAIQGAGNVGARLAKLAAEDGADVVICDVDESKALEAAATAAPGATGTAEVIQPGEFLHRDVDILAPCALGALFTPENVGVLNCSVICGGSNNQLASDEVADQLAADGVFYCPDFLANAGGIIDLHYQLNDVGRGGLAAHLDGLGETLERCHQSARAKSGNMLEAAKCVAEARFQSR